jgi:hypothetical protein
LRSRKKQSAAVTATEAPTLTDDPSRYACDDRERRHFIRHDRPGRDDRAFTHADAVQDHRVRADPGPAADVHRAFGKTALRGDRARPVVEMVAPSAHVAACGEQRLLFDHHAADRAHHAAPAEVHTRPDANRAVFARENRAAADERSLADRHALRRPARIEHATVVDERPVSDLDAPRMAQHESATEHDAAAEPTEERPIESPAQCQAERPGRACEERGHQLVVGKAGPAALGANYDVAVLGGARRFSLEQRLMEFRAAAHPSFLASTGVGDPRSAKTAPPKSA